MKCEYCGNISGKTDTWGGCISCGARLTATEVEIVRSPTFYTGLTGSNAFLPQPYHYRPVRYLGKVIDGSLLSANEARRGVGFPEITEWEWQDELRRFGV